MGEPPTTQHIVDHIDTNRQNNRPENLRWITKLENILLNPIILSRIVYRYGSIDDFLSNPSKPLNGELDQNFAWMRTVTKAELDNTRKNLINWAKQEKIPKGGQLGKWVFSNLRQQPDSRVEKKSLTESLTPNAVQKNWKTPSEFPHCPQPSKEGSIETYGANLKIGEVFSCNKYSSSIIENYSTTKEKNILWVICKNSIHNAIKPWVLAQVTYENDRFVHENLGGFFEKKGAEKSFIIAQGLEWTGGDTFDDFV